MIIFQSVICNFYLLKFLRFQSPNTLKCTFFSSKTLLYGPSRHMRTMHTDKKARLMKIKKETIQIKSMSSKIRFSQISRQLSTSPNKLVSLKGSTSMACPFSGRSFKISTKANPTWRIQRS